MWFDDRMDFGPASEWNLHLAVQKMTIAVANITASSVGLNFVWNFTQMLHRRTGEIQETHVAGPRICKCCAVGPEKSRRPTQQERGFVTTHTYMHFLLITCGTRPVHVRWRNLHVYEQVTLSLPDSTYTVCGTAQTRWRVATVLFFLTVRQPLQQATRIPSTRCVWIHP